MASKLDLLDRIPASTAEQMAGSIDPEMINDFLNTPTSLDNVRRDRGFLAPVVVHGYTPLASSLDTTVHQPVAPQAEAAKAGLPHAALSGRLGDIPVGVGTQIEGGTESRHVLSVVDSDWVQGRVYAEVEAQKAEEKKEFSIFNALKNGYAFAVFEQDPNVPHPLERNYPAYRGLGDWRLSDVITSEDANPANGHFKVIAGWLDKGNNSVTNTPQSGDETLYQAGLLSDIGEMYEDRLKAMLGRGWRSEIDKVMLAFHQKYVEGKPTKVSATTRDLVDQYKANCASIFDWRIPARGHARMLQLNKFEADYKKNYGRRIPSKEIKRLDIYREQARKEVVQALGMNQLAHQLGIRAFMMAQAGGKEVSPLLWRVRGVDDFDLRFANQRLPDAFRGRKAATPEEMSQVAEVKNIKEVHGQLAKMGAKLILEAGDGYQLFINGGQKGHPAFPYNGTNGIRQVDRGGTPDHINISAYDTYRQVEGVPGNLLGGMVCMFAAKSGGERAQRFMLVDALEAPSAVLRRINEMGYFERTKQGLPDRPYLSNILATQPKRPSIYVTTSKPDGTTTVNAELTEGQAVLATYDDSRKAVTVHPTETHPYKNLEGIKMERGERRRYAKRRAVLQPKTIPPDAQLVSGVAFDSGTVHLQDGAGHQSTIMPTPSRNGRR